MSRTDKFWKENKDLLMKSEMGEEFTQEECEKVLMCWYGTHLENEDLANEIKELKTSQQWQPIATAPLKQRVIVMFGNGQVGTMIFDEANDRETTSYAKYWISIPPLPNGLNS